MEEWETQRQLKSQIGDLFIDEKFLDIQDETQRKIARAFKCSLCKGIVKPNPVMCGSCENVFCAECIIDLKTQKLNETQSSHIRSNMEIGISGAEDDGLGPAIGLPSIDCPLCRKKPFTGVPLPIPMQSQLDALVFKCCQDCHEEYPDQTMSY